MSQERISIALTELLRASQGVYGGNVVITVGFDVVLGQSRDDVTNTGIDSFIDLDDEDNFGNK